MVSQVIVEKEKIVGREKEAKRKFYDDKQAYEGIKIKIEKSKKLNAERLKMMSKRSELVNEAIQTSEGEIA